MGTEINVYSDAYMYSEFYRDVLDNPFHSIEINDIYVKPPSSALWFTTNMKISDKSRPDMYKSFVHIHDNMLHPLINTQYDKGMEPILITKPEIYYDPKPFDFGEIVIRPPLLWGKPLWRCKVGKYKGDERPKGKMKVGYNWFYDYHKDVINFILGYGATRSVPSQSD